MLRGKHQAEQGADDDDANRMQESRSVVETDVNAVPCCITGQSAGACTPHPGEPPRVGWKRS